MIDNFKKIEDLFVEINKAIEKKVDVYILGGGALLKRGMKPATKDVDIVVSTKKEFLELQKALDKLNFAPQTPGKEYKHMNLSQIFQKGEFRIDLFEKEICGKVVFSENMAKRAERALELSKINIFLCSNEDILLFKTMTEREGDLTDCISIATTQDPDWNIILEELKNQIKQTKQDVWITWVGERLDILVERGLNIPIMKEIDKLREEYYEKYLKVS